jgi:hypothetical protein
MLIGNRERCACPASRDAGQQRLALRGRCGERNRGRRERNGRKEGRRQQHTAHLLAENRKLDAPETRSADICRQRDSAPTQLLADRVPARLVVAGR